MYANGFLEQKRRSPASLAAVVGLHGAALATVMIFGTTTFQKMAERRLIAVNLTDPQPPPPDPLPRHEEQQPPRRIDRLTVAETEHPPVGPIAGPVTPPTPSQPPTTPEGPRIVIADTTPALPPPVRRTAQVDPNYRDALQPPYPRDMEQAQRNGSVRVRITIGTDGRVSAIDRLSATEAAFWRVTERQARSRWRFRPATVDGRPVVSTMVMTVTFRIPDGA